MFAGNEDMHKISDEFEFQPDRTTMELAALERLKTFPLTYNRKMLSVSMLARSFLIKSLSKLLVTRTSIKAWKSLI